MSTNPVAPESRPVAPRGKSGKPAAVIVDDSLAARQMVRTALEAVGFEIVAEGDNGAQALTLYERHRPDLITLDIILPLLDGATAAALLLKRHPGAVVVMCSSLSNRDKILACRAAGVSYFLLKPVDPAKIAEVAASIAQRHVQAARAAEGA